MQIIKSNFITDFCGTASRITNTVRYTALIVYLRILTLCLFTDVKKILCKRYFNNTPALTNKKVGSLKNISKISVFQITVRNGTLSGL